MTLPDKYVITLNGKQYRVLSRSVEEVSALPPASRSGSLSYSIRQGEETAAQVTWHMGAGRGEIRDPSEKGQYHYSQNADPRIRGQIILGPLLSTDTISTNAEAKVQFIEFNGTTYAIGARYVHSLSGTTWTMVRDMTSSTAVKGCATVFGGNLYVADGTDGLHVMNSAGTWSAGAAFTTPKLLATVGTSIWCLSNVNQLQSSTDATTWATAITVGSGVDTATALLDYNGFPHIVKPDGLFFYDGQNLWNVYPEIAWRKNTANGSGSAVARGTIYVPVGPQVAAYSADLIVPDVVNPKPDRAAGLETRGTFLDFAPDSDYLWGVFKSQGGNYYITAYDFNPDPGKGWHQVVKTGTTALTAIGVVSSTTAPFVVYSESTSIKRFLLPRDSVNPYFDTNYRYAATGDIYLSQETFDYDDVDKTYISVALDTAGCDAGKTVAVKYAIDGGTEATLAAISTNGSQEKFFPAGKTGKRIAFHLTLATDASTASPQVFPIALRFKYRFKRVRRWSLTIAGSRNARPNVPQSADQQLTNLTTARNTIDGVAFTDVDGTTATVFVESVGDANTTQTEAGEKVLAVVLTEKRAS